jgi:hypothetical protein
VPETHWVCPLGHPHVPFVRFTHEVPDAQHAAPHGVVPDAQQHAVVRSEHVSPRAQQLSPHTVVPAAHPHLPWV